MAILENRVKVYSKRSKHRYIKTASFSIIPAINLLAILGIFVFLINFNFLSLNNYIVDFNGATYSKVINPVKEFIQSSVNMVINVANFDRLHNENLKLRVQNKNLTNEVASIQKIKIENIQLTKAMNIVTQENSENLKAKLVYQSSSESDYLAVIAAGKNHDLKTGGLVLTGGYLAGRIVTVGNNYSKVSLVNSPNSRIPVKTMSTGIKAILVGKADKGGYLLHLSGNQLPEIGELIVTSGDGKFYPKDIPVARVEKIIGKDVFVSINSDVSNTDFVEIIDPASFDS